MWDSFLAEALQYLRDRQEQLRRDFDLNRWQRYDYDQVAGTIQFSSDGKTGVIADIDVVGSTSTGSGTWIWSWANSSIEPAVAERMLAVRQFGEVHEYSRLTDALWKGDEVDGWEMTAVAAHVLKAEGAYRSPDDNGALFMLMRNVRHAPN